MRVLTFPKSQLGPIIEVSVRPTADGLAELKKAGQAVPSPKKVKLLVDTGAQSAALEESFALSFGVPYIKLSWSSTLHGVLPDRQYGFEFTLIGTNNVRWESGPIKASSRPGAFAGAPYVGLIGRDLLDQGLFIFNGPAHHCTLAF